MKVIPMQNWWQAGLSLVLAGLIISCATEPKPESNPNRFSLLSYNVENLFDTQDDPGTLDETYLPKNAKFDAKVQERCKLLTTEKYQSDCLTLDWSDKVLELKMGRLAHVIRKFKGDIGPDILVMPEVENLRVLKEFNEKHLKEMKFQTVVLLEGEDERGIDVGLLSKFPLSGTPKLHSIDLSQLDYVDKNGKISGKGNGTRGILEVPLQLPNGDQLTVFGVHFPSPTNPRAFRQKALEVLDKVTKDKRDHENVIVAGDFNITDAEDKSAGFYTTILSKNWGVSHLVGCKSCKGSHAFKGEWSFLDAILVSKSLMGGENSKWKLDKKSIRLITNSVYQSGRFPGSAKFDADRATGVSDHYPIGAEFELNQVIEQKPKTETKAKKGG